MSSPMRCLARKPMLGCCDTLLPFLYLTKTIQRSYGSRSTLQALREEDDILARSDEMLEERSQQQPAMQAPTRSPRTSASGKASLQGVTARRKSRPNARAPKSAHDFVPFETKQNEIVSALGSTTITPRERKAFEDLFDLVEVPKVADKKLQLPKVLEPAVLAEMSKTRAARDIRKDAPKAIRPAKKKQSDTKPIRLQAEFYNNRNEPLEYGYVKTRLDRAKTDIEQWNLFITYVLGRVVHLNLDTISTTKQRSMIDMFATLQLRRTRPFFKNDETMLPITLPRQMMIYVESAQQKFPSSLLALNALPTLQTLGPTAFSMGASTSLFNMHMRILWEKYFDVQAVVDVLDNMHRDVFPFDADTEALLIRIIKDVHDLRKATHGPALQSLFSTGTVLRQLKQLYYWRNEVEKWRQDDALRKAREDEELSQAGVE